MAELDNEELRRLKDVNMDEAPARRLVRDCFKDIQHNLDHILIKVNKNIKLKLNRSNLFDRPSPIEMGIRKVETLDSIYFSFCLYELNQTATLVLHEWLMILFFIYRAGPDHKLVKH